MMIIIIIRTGGTCRRYYHPQTPQREMVIRACQASVGFSVRVLFAERESVNDWTLSHTDACADHFGIIGHAIPDAGMQRSPIGSHHHCAGGWLHPEAAASSTMPIARGPA